MDRQNKQGLEHANLQAQAIAYNQHQIRFTTIQAIVDDEGHDAIMETTREIWDVEYARKVQAFLNKVL
jgi:hypothetical protein